MSCDGFFRSHARTPAHLNLWPHTRQTHMCEFTKIQAHLHPPILQIKSYISFFEGNKIHFDVYGSRNTSSLTYICQWFSYLLDTEIFAPEISQYCPSIPQNDDSIHQYILPRTNVFPQSRGSVIGMYILEFKIQVFVVLYMGNGDSDGHYSLQFGCRGCLIAHIYLRYCTVIFRSNKISLIS